jgi:DNA-binding transcriptional LysR family regulator
MELHEIRYFLALGRSLNFTKAAQACHVSQPALTRAIRKLEDEFGGLLFCRERNNIRLTELGRLMVPHLQEASARIQAAKATAGRFLRPEREPSRPDHAPASGAAHFALYPYHAGIDAAGDTGTRRGYERDAVFDRLLDLNLGEVIGGVMAPVV